MLTITEKQILGYMVDMGMLRGEQREAVGASDVAARAAIAEFKANTVGGLAMQINNLTTRKAEIDRELQQTQTLLNLLETS